MPLTVRELAAHFDRSERTIRTAIRAAGVESAGVEPRPVRRLHDVRFRPIRVYDLVDVQAAITARRPPPGLNQRDVARALGKHPQSIRNWTRQGLPCERIGRFLRYDVEACRAWLVGRPKRQHRGRRLNGGTVNHPLAVGLELRMRDQLRRVAAEHDVSIGTLLREGARRLLAALGEPVDPPERLPHLRADHPFRKAQMR